MRAFAFDLALVLAVAACAHRQVARAVATADALPGALGQRIAVVGVAENWKLGPRVVGEAVDVWVDAASWPSDVRGQRVEVVGRLEERHDLPAFVPDPTEPPMQGIPAPAGTDVRVASHRYVLVDPEWRVLR